MSWRPPSLGAVIAGLCVLCAGLPLTAATITTAAQPRIPASVTVEKLKFPIPGKPDVAVPATLVRPNGAGATGVVVLLPEDRGCTDWEHSQAQQLAAMTRRAVLLVDLYRGQVPADEDAAHILERGLPAGQAVRDVRLVLDGLTDARRAELRLDRVGVVGTGLGAAVALELACSDARVAAVVLCYGRLILDPEKLRPLRAEVLGIYAAHDVGIDDDLRQRFARAMVKAGKKEPTLIVYPHVEHGFLRPGEGKTALVGPAAEAAAQAWKRIGEFLVACMPSN